VLFAFAAPASPTPYTPDHPRPNCERLYKLGLFKAQLRRSFSERRWKDPTPVKPRERRQLRTMKRCAATPWHKRRMRQLERQARKAHRERRRDRLHRQRERRELLPYRGPDGRRWAIPWYIVRCESGGNFRARNPVSTAGGAYQIIDSTWYAYGGSRYADSHPAAVAPKREQHRVAARVLAGQGLGAWECA